ncbi:nuclear pore complex protein Nup153 isoform X1 [Stigmatopora nigra]
MAATGGGKIRSRRYHVASKPYAKSKQQSSGLISRVTDTVKSIVPSWLQNYFKNGEPPEGEAGGGGGAEAADVNENCQSPSPDALPPNGGKETPPFLDGRHSPEPSTSSNAEPSTSRASLNFQDYVLSRPPLSHSHLHFTPLETSLPPLSGVSSPFSQPSTSAAPGPFSTGFSLVKEIKDNLSQHEDDNISTTSGFSSRASDKDVPTAKTASLPQLWSPETDRTISVLQPSQSSLKRPAFNLSVFGSPANSTLNSTILNSSQPRDSPFYPGKTTYGGASAVRSARNRPGTPYQAPVRRQIKAKPASAQPCGVTSATARRILQSLERMSSPLADAKRIPAPSSSPYSMSLEGSHLDSFQLKRKRLDSNLPPVQKLVVPTSVPASANRSVSFRPSLTPAGPNRTLERTTRKKPTRQSPVLPERNLIAPSQSIMGSSSATYPISSTPAATSGGGKMKRERMNTARPSTKRVEDDEVTEVPNLPAISLPISSSALPTFSFSSSLPPAATSPRVTVTPFKEALTNKETPASSLCLPFTFSSPIVKATPSSPPTFSPSAGFTFSAPAAKPGPSMSNGKLATPIATAAKLTTNANTEDFDGPFKPAKTLKQGSVLDLLKSPSFASTTMKKSSEASTQSSTPSSSTTSTSFSTSSTTNFIDIFKTPTGGSCDASPAPNKPSDTSFCSKSPKPCVATIDIKTSAPSAQQSKSSTNSTPLASLFSKPTATWECDTCMVFNKAEAVKCQACETARPGTVLKVSSCSPSAFSAVKTPPAAATTPFAGFDKFKKAEGAWDCDVCMLQNKAADTKCVACTSAKPGSSAGGPPAASSMPVFSFGDKFKKPENSWDCDVCLLQNKGTDLKCVACQAVKPGAQAELKDSSSSGGFTFGTTNGTSGSAPGGFKFGVSASESSSASSGGFKFGLPFGNAPSESPSKDANPSLGFKFSTPSEGFKFGVSPSEEKKAEQPAGGVGFKFGASGGISFGTTSTSTESASSKMPFSFGIAKPEENMSTAPCPTSTASVATPVSSEEKSSDNNVSRDAVTTAGPVFGAPNPVTTTPTFGTFPMEKKSDTPTFAFGKAENEKKEAPATSAPASFIFGGSGKDAADPATAAPGGFSFGKPSTPAEQPPPQTTTFLFGKATEKDDTSNSKPPNSTFVFGQTAPASEAPPFFFMGSNTTTTTSGTSSTPTTSLFSNVSQVPAPVAVPNTFLFGQAAVATSAPGASDAPPAKAFVFGQSQDAASAPSVNTAQTGQPFIFGAPATAAPVATPAVNFGAAAPSVTPSAAPNPFLVSSSSTNDFGANQTPAFGSSFGSPFPSATSQPPAFGAKPAAAPAFGQQANSSPAFGAAANSTQGGGFQFGGASGFGSSNSAPVFNFGAGAAASPAPAAPTGGGFNFSQPLAFNIGSSKSLTSSPAGPPTIPGRKIKMAVRRRK